MYMYFGRLPKLAAAINLELHASDTEWYFKYSHSIRVEKGRFYDDKLLCLLK